MHNGQWIVCIYILGTQLDNHTRIAPLGSTVGGAHTIDNDLLGSCCSGYYKTAGTHAKAINAPSVNLSDHAILCSRKVFAATLLTVILYLVYKYGGMLESYTDSNAFGLYLNIVTIKIAINVASTMTRRQNDRSTPTTLVTCHQIDGLYTNNGVALCDEAGHFGLEMHLTATSKDSVAHVFYNSGQLVGTYMRMGINQNGCGGTVLTEHIKYFVDIATLLAARKQLAIRVSASSAFTKTIVGLFIHLLGLGNECHIALTVMDILSTLKHNRLIPKFYQSQSSKQAAGALSYHEHLRLVIYLGIDGALEVTGRKLIDVDSDREVDEYITLTGIYRPFDNARGRNLRHIDALFVCQKL